MAVDVHTYCICLHRWYFTDPVKLKNALQDLSGVNIINKDKCGAKLLVTAVLVYVMD